MDAIGSPGQAVCAIIVSRRVFNALGDEQVGMLDERETERIMRDVRHLLAADWPRDVPIPELPRWRQVLLQVLLSAHDAPDSVRHTLGQAFVLIDLGLKLHETLDDAYQEKTKPYLGLFRPPLEAWAKYLTAAERVLLGDLLSSRYFLLLAEAGLVDAIRRFAQAIEEVHAHKALLWQYVRSELPDVMRLFNLKVNIESALFQAVMPEGMSWRELPFAVVQYHIGKNLFPFIPERELARFQEELFLVVKTILPGQKAKQERLMASWMDEGKELSGNVLTGRVVGEGS